MSGHRIIASEISVGRPLPWDVYDGSGVLLLRRGFVIESQRAIDRLIEEGVFLADKDSNEANGGGQPDAGLPSPLRLLMDARKIVGALPPDAAAIPGFTARMLRAVQYIETACEQRADIAIASILLLQDEIYPVRHAVNVAIIACLLARAMKLPGEHAKSTIAAALTMNISKHDVHDKLNGTRGELNEKLRRLIAAHPTASRQRLIRLGVEDRYWLECVEQHHEREDGTGYPNRLTGREIQRGAKIIALADRYCARVSRRGYRPMCPPGVALRDLYIESGGQIDTHAAAHLVRIVGIYPPGTIVRLFSGEIAVVTKATDNPDEPVTHAILGASGAALTMPVRRRTALQEFRIIDTLTLDRLDCPIQMSRLWGDAARIG